MALGIGIIGCGAISRLHIDAFRAIDGVEIRAVSDAVAEVAAKGGEQRNVEGYGDYKDLLKREDIDVVSICTPSGLHAPMAQKAAEAGKHFVVEKPFAITKEQIAGVISACEKNNVKGAVISQLRFTQSVKFVKKAIEVGVLGNIILEDVYMKYYRSPEYYASSSWKGTWAMDGGGALMNQGIHGIDVLQYLVGPVKSVYGICKTLARDIEVEDTANLVVEYQNGAIGTIQGTTSVNPGYPRIIEISGTKGTVILTEDVITKWDVEGEKPDLSNLPKGNFESFRDPAGFAMDNHRMQIADLIDAIENDRSPIVDVYEGKKPVDIILAAYESNKTKKPVYLD